MGGKLHLLFLDAEETVFSAQHLKSRVRCETVGAWWWALLFRCTGLLPKEIRDGKINYSPTDGGVRIMPTKVRAFRAVTE